MANYSENIESEQQEWDMEFKDPFSLEEDELAVYCSGSISQPPVVTTISFSDGHLAVETSNDVLVQQVNTVVSSSLQTVTHDNKPAATDLELTNCKENFHQHQLEIGATTCLSTAVSDESKTAQHTNEPATPHNVESSCNEAEEQSPIPVMLSSAKRFCAAEDIENSRATKQGRAYFRLPSPSTYLSNSPSSFAQPAYPLGACNMPAWPASSLPVSNSGARVQIPPVVPYNNCVPYSVILSRPSNIPLVYNQSRIPLVASTATARWPDSQLQLHDILSKPPPPVPAVSHTAVLGLPGSNLAVHTSPVPHLQNGLSAHRLPLATVTQVIPPFPPPNINISASSHSVLLLSQQCQPRNIVSVLAKSSLPVVSSVSLSAGQIVPHCDAVSAQQSVPLSANADASTLLSSPVHIAQRSNKHLKPSGKSVPLSEHLRSQPVTGVLSTVACSGLLESNLCPPLTSSGFASKQTVTLPLSCSSTPPPRIKCSSAFAQLDPRIHNGHRQSAAAASQIPSSANAASSPSPAFVVPVPPPLPSLEELTAERSKDSQKNDKATTTGLTSQSTTTGSTVTDSSKLDRVISSNNCQLSCEIVMCTVYCSLNFYSDCLQERY